MPLPRDDEDAVVIDNGSCVLKAGFSGDDVPRAVLSTVVGRPKEQAAILGATQEQFIGNGAQDKRGVLALNYPIVRGIVTDWDDMEDVWKYVFNTELKTQSEDHPVFLTETVNNPDVNRENMTQLMFETFGVPSLFVSVDAVLAMYASGHTTGVVVLSGDGVTSVVPIYDGFGIAPAVQRIELAGRDITLNLQTILNESGYVSGNNLPYEVVRDMKERLCFSAMDFEAELKLADSDKSLERLYKLPDGIEIKVKDARFKCVEAMFQPSLIGLEGCGLHQSVYNSVIKTGLDLRKEFFKNIFLGGGSMKIPGFDCRLKRELLKKVTTSMNVNVQAISEPEYAVWMGGSILGCLRNYKAMWIAKEEYDEHGPGIVGRKCFKF